VLFGCNVICDQPSLNSACSTTQATGTSAQCSRSVQGSSHLPRMTHRQVVKQVSVWELLETSEDAGHECTLRDSSHAECRHQEPACRPGDEAQGCYAKSACRPGGEAQGCYGKPRRHGGCISANTRAEAPKIGSECSSHVSVEVSVGAPMLQERNEKRVHVWHQHALRKTLVAALQLFLLSCLQFAVLVQANRFPFAGQCDTSGSPSIVTGASTCGVKVSMYFPEQAANISRPFSASSGNLRLGFAVSAPVPNNAIVTMLLPPQRGGFLFDYGGKTMAVPIVTAGGVCVCVCACVCVHRYT
jgi:hypothetical protein